MPRMLDVLDRIRELETDLEREVRGPHPHYRLFVDYGDAEGYKGELPVLREGLAKEKEDEHP